MKPQFFAPIAALALSAAALPAWAEPLNYHLIQFQETVSQEVRNDWLTINFRIENQAPSREAAQAATTRALNIFQAQARAISGAEVRLWGRNAYPLYNNGNNHSIRAWQDTARIQVASGDFQALAKLMAQTARQASIDNTWFSLKPDTERQLINQLSTEALNRFRERAQVLSRAMGGNGFEVVEVSLQQSLEAERKAYAAPMMMRAAAADSATPEVSFDSPGTTTVQQTASGKIQYR